MMAHHKTGHPGGQHEQPHSSYERWAGSSTTHWRIDRDHYHLYWVCLPGRNLVPLCPGGVDSLVKSIFLASSGVTTTGTVTSVEEFSSARANFPSTSYKLTVSFQVDGETYSIRSNAYYKPIGKSWVGETMPIIYDPENPEIVLIDTFQERWLEPIVNSAP